MARSQVCGGNECGAIVGLDFDRVVIAFQFSTVDGNAASAAIRLYSHGWATHVDCALPDGRLLGARSDAIGGQPSGVQIRPPGYEKWSRTEIVQLACTGPQMEKWLTFLEAQVGKPYDLVDLAANFVLGRDWRNPDAWWCSELGAASFEASEVAPHPFVDDVQLFTPMMLLVALSPWRAAVN